jgi:V/A-type H+-transporting ATPase subunit K
MGNFIYVVSGIIVITVALGVVCIKRGLRGKTMRRILGINIISVFGMLGVAFLFTLPNASFAAVSEAANTAVNTGGDGLRYLAAALSTGLSTIGAGIAVAATGSAALGAISEDSKLLGKTLIFVGLSEGIAIYGLIVTIMILP